MALPSSEMLHASSVAIGGQAVLITGLSGSGKSDLALRLIDRGATLLSDDYTLVTRAGSDLTASAPATIKGKLEVRGLGIIDMIAVDSAPVALIVRLGEDVPRLPERLEQQSVAGVDVAVVALPAFEASTAIKVELALRRVIQP